MGRTEIVEIDVISGPADLPNYVDKAATAVGWGVYLFGCQIDCEGLDLPVFVPDDMIDATVTEAICISSHVFESREQADAAIRGFSPPRPGLARYAYFWGAGGRIVAPTLFCPATTPRIVRTLLSARQLLVDQIGNELTRLAIGMVGGAVIKIVVVRVLRIGTGEPTDWKGLASRIKQVLKRLRDTVRQVNGAVRSSEVLMKPTVFRHTLTADVPAASYVQIERQGVLNVSQGVNATYGEGVYAWRAGQQQVRRYIDIEVPAGTGVETIQANGQTFVRMLPSEGNTLSVKPVSIPECKFADGSSGRV